MDCLRPVHVRNPVFKSKRWQVDSEYRQLHKDEPFFVDRPCGKCLNCMKRRQNDWAFRIQSESKAYFGRTFFVTMTMDNESLHSWYHISTNELQKRIIKETGDLTLLLSTFPKSIRRSSVSFVNPSTLRVNTSCPSIDKKDLQDYFKRLRKSGLEFHYFACGEYGDKFARSHYHCIFWTEQPFTFDQFKERIFPYWHLCSEDAFEVRSIDTTLGGIPVSKYVAKYSVKRVGYDYKDCLPPFAIMSKDHPIGSSFLTVDNYRQLRTNDTYLVYDSQGTRYSLPRYFRNKVFSESERKRLSDSVVDRMAILDRMQARLQNISIDEYYKRKLSHNRYLEKSYFDRLRIQRFGYDFEIVNPCLKTEI